MHFRSVFHVSVVSYTRTSHNSFVFRVTNPSQINMASKHGNDSPFFFLLFNFFALLFCTDWIHIWDPKQVQLSLSWVSVALERRKLLLFLFSTYCCYDGGVFVFSFHFWFTLIFFLVIFNLFVVFVYLHFFFLCFFFL